MDINGESVRGPILKDLVAQVKALDPKPRERQWVSLSFCLIDAVFSINAKYDAVVVPAVRRVAAAFNVEDCTQPAKEALRTDPVPVNALRDRFGDESELVALTNRQRTSTRSGILKADAVLRHAAVMENHGLHTLADARALLTQEDRLAAVDRDLRKIPGEGSFGVRRGYLWMLVGASDLIKPDRMVLRWLKRHGAAVDASEARGLLKAIAECLSAGSGRVVTPWEIDHAIWLGERSR